MSFGLRNAGQTFQRFIDEVTQGLDFCFPYVDDILVFSKDDTEHEEHLRTLFIRLVEYGILINTKKSVLFSPVVKFLGYEVSADGTKPLPDRISALMNFTRPSTAVELRRFLGMINFYRHFIPSASKYQAPLHTLLSGIKGNNPISWTPELEQAFEACKDHLKEVTLLAHPDPNAPLGLFTDASNVAVGACLQQRVGNDWEPLAFFSKKLTPRQSEWPAYYRELLAVYSAVQNFRHILQAQHCTIFTDHKPLTYAFQQHKDKLPPVQLNQISFIAQFTTDIQFVSGASNMSADFMSRVNALSMSTPIDLQALPYAQKEDPELKELLKNNTTSLNLQLTTLPGTDLQVYCDTTTRQPRPFIPASLRRQVFNSIHNLSHPGVKATNKLISQRFVWPNMHRDCQAWTRACQNCQKAKITRHVHSPLSTFSLPSARFQHVHIDLIGPLPPAGPYRYCLTAVDRFTRWPEVWPLKGITAQEVAEALINCWISRFGTPTRITTDQGTQFESNLFKHLGVFMGSQRHRTCSYHPCANGMVERFHRQLKAAIMCHPNATWLEALPVVLLGIRSAFRPDLNSSAAELVYGEPLRLPGELIVAPETSKRQEDPTDFVIQLRRHMENLRPTPGSQHGKQKPFVFQDLKTCSHIFLRDDTVRKSLQPPYTGPYPVVIRDEKTLTILIKGQNVKVTIDRVKPAYILTDSSDDTHCLKTAQPPKTQPAVASKPSTSLPLKETSPPEYTTRSGRRVRFKLP